MSAELLVWGINHKGNGGFNTTLFESKITPIDVQDSVSDSDLRETRIIKENNSKFYSISLSSNHRIYSIYTYSKDHQDRNGFTAISIYTNKNRVLSNIFVSLNKALELYLQKRDSTYPNMFELILDNIEGFQNYNNDENKSSGTSCFYGTGENHIKHFLDNPNTQQYQKVYATHDNEKIKERYPAYSNHIKSQPINIPLNSKDSNRTTYLYILGSVVLLIIMGWFISTLFNNHGGKSGGRTGGSGGKQSPVIKQKIEDRSFGDYNIKINNNGEKQDYYWAEKNGNQVNAISKIILLINENKDKLKDHPDVLKNLKLSIQTKLISEGGG